MEEWAERWVRSLASPPAPSKSEKPKPGEKPKKQPKPKKPRGPGEVNKWLRYSQTAWNPPWGKRRAEPEYQFNPFKYIDRFQVERRAKYVPTDAEVNKIRMAADGEFRLYLEILIETGARPSEGLDMTWEDVHPGSVILYTKKTGSGDRLPRRVDISEGLQERFKSWRRTQGPGSLYVFQQVLPRSEQPEARWYSWARIAHARICRLAGVEPFSVGCYRHYHAVSMYGKTKDVLAVQRRLGHRDIKTTQNYLASLTGV